MHMLFLCTSPKRPRGHARHSHFQSYFSIYISFAHTQTLLRFYVLLLLLFLLFNSMKYNVQWKFHIHFHHLKKIVPVSRNENEYRTYNNNHDHWIRKRVFYCFLCVCVKDDATMRRAIPFWIRAHFQHRILGLLFISFFLLLCCLLVV